MILKLCHAPDSKIAEILRLTVIQPLICDDLEIGLVCTEDSVQTFGNASFAGVFTHFRQDCASGSCSTF